MKSEEKRQKIIEAGANLIHENGFNNTGLKEITDAVGIPKGSFYYFFKSKDDFGLKVIDYYSGFFSRIARQMLALPEKSALERMEEHFIFFENYFIQNDYGRGCPVGNLAQEMGSHNTEFAESLYSVMQNMSDSVYMFLQEAAENKEIPRINASKSMADFIIDSWEGTILRMKVQHDISPLSTWRKYICRTLLLMDKAGSGL